MKEIRKVLGQRLNKLVRHLRHGEALEECINSNLIPEAVLIAFSCDCVEEMLDEEERIGSVIDTRAYEAIDINRQFYAGENNTYELTESQKWVKRTHDYWSSFMQGSEEGRRVTFMLEALKDLLYTRTSNPELCQVVVQKALNWSRLFFEKEHADHFRMCQHTHLANLIEEYQRHRQKLVSVLFERKEQFLTKDRVESWQGETEELMFS